MSKPTTICVLGMHRSGTSLVMRVLNVLGVELGPEEHLMRPSSANPAGHWESRPVKDINDEILARLGGTWSEPPELAPGWELSTELAEPRRKARELIEADFADSRRWGFKDPRLSLTAPFWQRLLGPMRYVVCVRNPVDVAASLAARDAEPIPFEQGVELWLAYTRAALEATAGHPREFVFYEDLMVKPKPVVDRLAEFVGADRTKSALAEAQEALWHHRTAVPTVVDAPRVSFQAKAVYLALRLFVPSAEEIGDEALELLAGHAADERRIYAELEAENAELARVRARLAEVERRREALAERFAERGAELEEIAKGWADEELLRQELEAELERSRAEVVAMRKAEATRREAETQVPEEEAAQPPEAAAPSAAAATGSREQSRAEIGERARALIPAGSTVLVAAKGDDSLLELDGSRGLHFPAAPDGRYAGYHPAGDTAVIAQLEAQRARGADHLLLPTATLWWLEHYEGLRRHLDQRYESLVEDEQCAIYRLKPGEHRDASEPIAMLRQAVANLRIRSGRDPSVLDWGTGLGIADELPDVLVFAPPDEDPPLPYLDRTVDVVVLAAADADRAAEARRIAAQAVITVDPGSREHATLEWLAGGPSGWGEDVSVTLFPNAGSGEWRASLQAIAETLQNGFAGELTVVGDRAVLDLAGEQGAVAEMPVRSVEVDTGTSLAKRAQAAIKRSDRRVHALVTSPAVPIADWLPPMLPLFGSDRNAGVVGARILSGEGALEEAGGILDGESRQRRGEGDSDPDRPEYGYVQRVDFCSPPVLATERDVFKRLKGFDERRTEPADAVVDFSLRAGRAGAPVYYQPEARVVALGGGGS